MFFKEKGFYISLACGVIAIAAFAAICLNMRDGEDSSPMAVASNTPAPTSVATPETEEVLNGSAKSEVKETKTPKPTEKTVKTQSESVRNKLEFDQEAGLVWPVKGDVLMEYSADKVIYFKTLAEYRTNPALIIEAKEGCDVKASADGIVSSVTTSEETGRTVSVSIGDNFTVTYGQLMDVAVEKGDSVSEGQVIGKIAKPTKYYTEEGSNLYFQVKEKNQTVNPMLLLK